MSTTTTTKTTTTTTTKETVQWSGLPDEIKFAILKADTLSVHDVRAFSSVDTQTYHLCLPILFNVRLSLLFSSSFPTLIGFFLLNRRSTSPPERRSTSSWTPCRPPTIPSSNN